MKASSIVPPLMTLANVFPPDVVTESVTPALPNVTMSILSVVEKPEIAARSPKPELVVAETLSVLSPPSKVSVPPRLAFADSNSTVPPPLNTVLIAETAPLMASVPPLSTSVPVAVTPARNKSSAPPCNTVSLVTTAVAALTS